MKSKVIGESPFDLCFAVGSIKFSQEYRQVQRSIQLLRNQLDKVNTLLHMEENNQDQLEQGKIGPDIPTLIFYQKQHEYVY